MSYTVNYSFSFSSAGGSDLIQDIISDSFSADEIDRRIITVPANTDVSVAPVVVDLTNVSPTKRIIVTVSGDAQLRLNALTDDWTISSFWVYDGPEITTLNFGNSSTTEDITVKIIAFA